MGRVAHIVSRYALLPRKLHAGEMLILCCAIRDTLYYFCRMTEGKKAFSCKIAANRPIERRAEACTVRRIVVLTLILILHR